MSRMLNLTFHVKGENLNEDLRFKKFGLASNLITSDAMDDASASWSDELLDSHDRVQSSGIETATIDGHVVRSLGRVSFNAWLRKPFNPAPKGSGVFGRWFEDVVSRPASVLVLAGHHGNVDRDDFYLWGIEDKDQLRKGIKYYFYTALWPSIYVDSGTRRAGITFFGNKGVNSKRGYVTRAGRFDVTRMLESVRLILIMGCSGTNPKRGRVWQDWVSAVSPGNVRPVVLGWYGLHKMPEDSHGVHFSENFWRELKQRAGAAATIDEIYQSDGGDRKFIDSWGSALKQTYRNAAHHRDLWYASEGGAPEGAGAYDSTGRAWIVKRADGELELNQ